MSIRIAFVSCVLAMAIGADQPAHAGEKKQTSSKRADAMETGFLDRTVTVEGRDYRYQVYVPPDSRSSSKPPVILFLHGAGERGDDGLKQTAVGLPAAIRWERSRFPFLVVIPQTPADTSWWNASARAAMAALERSVAEFGGDRERVYLTGLSLGGAGVWTLAGRHPDLFAAIVPICGAVPRDEPPTSPFPDLMDPDDQAEPYAQFAKRLRHLPTWIFHGAKDDVVSPAYSRRIHRELKAAGADVRYTEYPDVGHNSWDPAYAEPELVPWLLSHRRKSGR